MKALGFTVDFKAFYPVEKFYRIQLIRYLQCKIIPVWLLSEGEKLCRILARFQLCKYIGKYVFNYISIYLYIVFIYILLYVCIYIHI